MSDDKKDGPPDGIYKGEWSGKHPNSLKNLVSFGEARDPEAMRKKGLETRRRNKAEREAMQQAVQAFQDLDIKVPDSETVLKIAMSKAIAAGDMDEATRIAALLMPYEKPKLASQEVAISQGVSDKTDEELEDLAKQMGLVVNLDGTER